MKSKEVIRLIRQSDPSGETEVCVGNDDIFFVSREPAYHDGCLRLLVRDKSIDGYNVTGVRYVESGDKVVIHTLSEDDVLLENPEAPIDYSGLTEPRATRYREADERLRQENRGVHREAELGLFLEWARELAHASFPYISEEIDDVGFSELAEDFFDRNLSYRDPLPRVVPPKAGEPGTFPSYAERRRKQWDEGVAITWDGKVIGIEKREKKEWLN